MRRVRVIVTATATIEETWTFDVADHWTADRLREKGYADVLLASGNAVSVTDRVVGDETDRKITDVEDDE